MHRVRARFANAVFSVAFIVTMTTVCVSAGNYTAHPQNGYPAGLIPECPGVTKNATISPRMLRRLQVTLHRRSDSGLIIRNTVPISVAPQVVKKDKHYDFKNKKTVLYAVGFWDHSWFLQTQAVGTAYSKRGYNVFLTQTFDFFTQIYPKSARIARTIGRLYGEFLVQLTDQGLQAEDLELVGMSLGAHVAGFAAKHFYSATGKKPSRITGLDPAGPCYRSLSPTDRLDSTDAERVDILHTNIDGFGIEQRLGHVDFYANGGEFQPPISYMIPCLVLCSHVKAVLYWIEAMKYGSQFIGVRCNSIEDARFARCFDNTETNVLGLGTDFGKPGVYYLPVNMSAPYWTGRAGLDLKRDMTSVIAGNMNAEDNFVI